MSLLEAMTTMRHFVTFCEDGTIHVQNYVGIYAGQHHVHTPDGYRRWKRGRIGKITQNKNRGCDCGLKPGDTREYDGRVWQNKKFGDEPVCPSETKN